MNIKGLLVSIGYECKNSSVTGRYDNHAMANSKAEKQQRAARSNNQRPLKIGKWVESLKASDVNQIWLELHRIVSSHPLVRASKQAGFLVEEGKYNAHTDLTQELFVALLSKERFQHYLDTEMSDAEIEAEISQIELTNMLTAELRKRYPEAIASLDEFPH